MKNEVWVVTYHFGRGHVVNKSFKSKQEAQKDVTVTVFNNEDCINCSIYRNDLSVISNMVQKTMEEVFSTK